MTCLENIISKPSISEMNILKNVPLKIRKLCSEIRLMAFDIDGVLTNGYLYYGLNGEILKQFNVLDGQGLRLLIQEGVKIALITGRSSQIASLYASELGVDFFLQGVKNKDLALNEIIQKVGISIKEVGFMGDDIIDLSAMKNVGFSASVSSAPFYVSRVADWISSKSGGNGAVRECCDLLLAAKNSLAHFF